MRPFLFAVVLLCIAPVALAQIVTVDMVRLELAGMPQIYVQDCDVIGTTTEVIEQPDKTGTGVIKTPGRLTILNLTCARGLTTDKTLANWRTLVEQGQIASARKNGSLVFVGNDLSEIARWNFTNAWPAKLHIETDEQSGNFVERISIVVESLVRQ